MAFGKGSSYMTIVYFLGNSDNSKLVKSENYRLYIFLIT